MVYKIFGLNYNMELYIYILYYTLIIIYLYGIPCIWMEPISQPGYTRIGCFPTSQLNIALPINGRIPQQEEIIWVYLVLAVLQVDWLPQLGI